MIAQVCVHAVCFPQRHKTALMEASHRGHLRIVEHLVEEGADIEATNGVSVISEHQV
jgi:hypothetical protein